MAINIGQQPQELARSGNALTYTFTSDQTNQDNFAYIVEVYKDGVIHSNHRVYPENGTYGRFDLSEIAEYELTKPNIPSSTYVDAGNYAEFYIIVKEFYGAIPVVGSTVSTFQTVVWKAKQSIFEPFDFSSFFPTPFGGSLLTYFYETTLYPEELLFLYALKLQGDPYIHLDYRNSAGFTHYANDIGLAQYKCLGINLSYDFIESNYGGIGWTDTAYVLITITDGTDYYNEYRINIVHEENCIKPTRLHWINKLGGMDSFSFVKPTRQEQQTNVESYQTSTGVWFGTFYGQQDDDTGNSTFQTESSKYLTLDSGFVSESEQAIMYDNLMTSPYVLVEWEERLIRVSRDSVTVGYKSNKLDQLFSVGIKINIENFKSMIV